MELSQLSQFRFIAENQACPTVSEDGSARILADFTHCLYRSDRKLDDRMISHEEAQNAQNFDFLRVLCLFVAIEVL